MTEALEMSRGMEGATLDLEVPQNPSILVIDDSPDNLTLMRGVLGAHYRVKVATNGVKGLAIARSSVAPDLILLDIMMPGIDGYEVCRRLKADQETRGIPVIFLTAKVGVQDETLGFELGAVDYITKPISPPIVLARVATHIAQKAMADFLRDKSNFLEEQVALRTRELQAVQDVTINALAALAENRDTDTGNHIRRTQHYVLALATRLKHHPSFSTFLSDRNIIMLFKSAPLHDIGKVGIPDRVLLKPGPLTAEEFEIMKTHTTIGRSAIEAAEELLGRPAEFLAFAKEIAFSHQEKWDGSGYPLGLAGEDIPISARLMALADVYDALISKRIYKSAVSHDYAVKVILEGRGRHFDPDVVDAFMSIEQSFRSIAERFTDGDQTMARQADKLDSALAEHIDIN